MKKIEITRREGLEDGFIAFGVHSLFSISSPFYSLDNKIGVKVNRLTVQTNQSNSNYFLYLTLLVLRLVSPSTYFIPSLCLFSSSILFISACSIIRING